MIRIEIPGRVEPLEIAHVVLDYNGTVAVDGRLFESVRSRLPGLLELVSVHVLTADTYGTVRAQCEPREIVEKLRGGVACFGNGFNDIPMFALADLSVAVLEGEGLCAALLPHADVLAATAADALDLLLKPDRLRATLRS